jgi:hypothetical protein
MGVLPFRDSGFLDGVCRSPSKDSFPNHNFRSYRFGISMHRSMGSPEPTRKDLRPWGLGGLFARICSIGDFHRRKRPPDGRWYGLELMMPCCRYVVVRACDCVRFMESECVFCLLLIVNPSALVYRVCQPPRDSTGPRQVSHSFRMII